jgi:ABC-type lipoprotein release transport system permease subunit
MVAVGVAAGTVLALAAGRWIASLVYGVSPRDPAVLAAAAAALLTVAVVACLSPARRAARVDPVETLRAD